MNADSTNLAIIAAALLGGPVVAAQAVGWENPPVWDLFVVLPLILLLAALPVAPSGLGLQEGAFYFFLHAVGANSGQALGVGIVLRAKSYAIAILGGLVWLRLRKSSGPGEAPVVPIETPNDVRPA